MTPWTLDTKLGGAETWCVVQNHEDEPLMMMVRWFDWLKEQGLNWTRLFSWQRPDYRPVWGSHAWRNRMEVCVNYAEERGIYVTPSVCQGVFPTRLVGEQELEVAAQLQEQLKDYPNVIWEFGNELRAESHIDGTVQKGIDILGRSGQPVVWASSEGEYLKIKAADAIPVRPVNKTVWGWTVHHEAQEGFAHFVDHVHADLGEFNTGIQMNTVDTAAEEGDVAFMALGSWTDSSGQTFGLPGWQGGRLADWLRPETLQRISERFVTGIPVEPPQPPAGPEANPPQDAARKFGALTASYFRHDLSEDREEPWSSWSKTPEAQQLMAEFRKHLFRESPKWAEAEKLLPETGGE